MLFPYSCISCFAFFFEIYLILTHFSTPFFSRLTLLTLLTRAGAIVGPDGFVVSAETGERLLGPDGNPMLPDGAAPVAAVKEDFSEENAKVRFF